MTESEIFAENLIGGCREFFLRMNESMACEEVNVQYEERRVTYFPDTKLKQQPFVLRYTVDKNGLTAEIKLNYIDCYVDLIEKMPEHMKNLFRTIKNCKLDECKIFDQKCGMRRVWRLDGKYYHLCSYKYYFTPDISNPDDVKYYEIIIREEIKAAKARKKHNTAI